MWQQAQTLDAGLPLSRGNAPLALILHFGRACALSGEIAPCSGFLWKLRIFDDHVLELTGFEDFTAFLAFDEFGVFFAGHDLHARVLALRRVAFLLGDWGRRGWSHKSGFWGSLLNGRGFRRKLAVF
jgi:hypothetical protein